MLPEHVSILAAAFLKINETPRLHYQPDWSTVFPGDSLDSQIISSCKSIKFPGFQCRGPPTQSCGVSAPFHVGTEALLSFYWELDYLKCKRCLNLKSLFNLKFPLQLLLVIAFLISGPKGWDLTFPWGPHMVCRALVSFGQLGTMCLALRSSAHFLQWAKLSINFSLLFAKELS